MNVGPPPPVPPDMTIDRALEISRAADKAFRKAAKVADRTPRSKIEKRKKRGWTAVRHLVAAIFYRTIAVEHQNVPGKTLVSEVEGPQALSWLWEEAKLRAELAAKKGALVSGGEARALDIAAKFIPGEDGLPVRGKSSEGGATFGAPSGQASPSSPPAPSGDNDAQLRADEARRGFSVVDAHGRRMDPENLGL